MTELTAAQGLDVPGKPTESNDVIRAAGREVNWQKIAQECWAGNDVTKCAPAQGLAKLQVDSAAGSDSRPGTTGRVALPDLVLTSETSGDVKPEPTGKTGAGDARVKATAVDDKVVKQQADAQTLMDGKATPEARLRAVQNLVDAKINNIQIQGADGKAYSIRLETLGAGSSRQMVHAFLHTEDGRESTALRGILKGDGTVEKERNKTGAFVDYEGRGGAKLETLEAIKIEFKSSARAQAETGQEKSQVKDEAQTKKRATSEAQLDAPRDLAPHDHSRTKSKSNDGSQGDGVVAPDRRTPRGTLDDRRVLAQVPDAQLIGQSGLVTSMSNRNGEIKPYWLAADAASALEEAQRILAPKGKQIIIDGKNGAGRTIDTQTEIYTRSQGGRSFAAGAPTKSNHIRGHALDIANFQDPDVFRALKAVGFRQGDSRGPIRGDEKHFSFPGGRRT